MFEGSPVVVLPASAALAVFLGLPGAFRIRWRLKEQLTKVRELEQRLQDLQARSQGKPLQEPSPEKEVR